MYHKLAYIIWSISVPVAHVLLLTLHRISNVTGSSQANTSSWWFSPLEPSPPSSAKPFNMSERTHPKWGQKKIEKFVGEKNWVGEEVHLLDETILVNQVVVRDDAPLLLQLQTSPCRPRVSPHVPPIEPGETSKEMRKVEIGIQLNFGIPVGISRNVFLFRCQKKSSQFLLTKWYPQNPW